MANPAENPNKNQEVLDNNKEAEKQAKEQEQISIDTVLDTKTLKADIDTPFIVLENMAIPESKKEEYFNPLDSLKNSQNYFNNGKTVSISFGWVSFKFGPEHKDLLEIDKWFWFKDIPFSASELSKALSELENWDSLTIKWKEKWTYVDRTWWRRRLKQRTKSVELFEFKKDEDGNVSVVKWDKFDSLIDTFYDERKNNKRIQKTDLVGISDEAYKEEWIYSLFSNSFISSQIETANIYNSKVANDRLDKITVLNPALRAEIKYIRENYADDYKDIWDFQTLALYIKNLISAWNSDENVRNEDYNRWIALRSELNKFFGRVSSSLWMSFVDFLQWEKINSDDISKANESRELSVKREVALMIVGDESTQDRQDILNTATVFSEIQKSEFDAKAKEIWEALSKNPELVEELNKKLMDRFVPILADKYGEDTTEFRRNKDRIYTALSNFSNQSWLSFSANLDSFRVDLWDKTYAELDLYATPDWVWIDVSLATYSDKNRKAIWSVSFEWYNGQFEIKSNDYRSYYALLWKQFAPTASIWAWYQDNLVSAFNNMWDVLWESEFDIDEKSRKLTNIVFPFEWEWAVDFQWASSDLAQRFIDDKQRIISEINEIYEIIKSSWSDSSDLEYFASQVLSGEYKNIWSEYEGYNFSGLSAWIIFWGAFGVFANLNFQRLQLREVIREDISTHMSLNQITDKAPEEINKSPFYAETENWIDSVYAMKTLKETYPRVASVSVNFFLHPDLWEIKYNKETGELAIPEWVIVQEKIYLAPNWVSVFYYISDSKNTADINDSYAYKKDRMVSLHSDDFDFSKDSLAHKQKSESQDSSQKESENSNKSFLWVSEINLYETFGINKSSFISSFDNNISTISVRKVHNEGEKNGIHSWVYTNRITEFYSLYNWDRTAKDIERMIDIIDTILPDYKVKDKIWAIKDLDKKNRTISDLILFAWEAFQSSREFVTSMEAWNLDKHSWNKKKELQRYLNFVKSDKWINKNNKTNVSDEVIKILLENKDLYSKLSGNSKAELSYKRAVLNMESLREMNLHPMSYLLLSRELNTYKSAQGDIISSRFEASQKELSSMYKMPLKDYISTILENSVDSSGELKHKTLSWIYFTHHNGKWVPASQNSQYERRNGLVSSYGSMNIISPMKWDSSLVDKTKVWDNMESLWVSQALSSALAEKWFESKDALSLINWKEVKWFKLNYDLTTGLHPTSGSIVYLFNNFRLESKSETIALNIDNSSQKTPVSKEEKTLTHIENKSKVQTNITGVNSNSTLVHTWNATIGIWYSIKSINDKNRDKSNSNSWNVDWGWASWDWNWGPGWGGSF